MHIALELQNPGQNMTIFFVLAIVFSGRISKFFIQSYLLYLNLLTSTPQLHWFQEKDIFP